jgi:flagellar hook-basal body complex protein FliE
VPGSTLTTGRIAEASPNGLSFVNALKNSLDAVNHDQNQVSELSKAYDLGNPNVDLSDVMVAVQKANVSFQSAVQVRNRLVSAYHDMMNMQI